MAFPRYSHGFILHPDTDHKHLLHGGDQELITTMMRIDDRHQHSNKINTIHQQEYRDPDGDDLSDDGSMQPGEKKKRLSVEQVKALERSFETANKIEPERKIELAKALGLKPRQVAIWFQNRRARWKTKQLERDYESLKKQFESLKADNDAFQAHNKILNEQLEALRNKDSHEANSEKQTDQIIRSKERDHKSSDLNFDASKNLFPYESTRPDLHCLKSEQVAQEDSFCNMFLSGIEEQHQGFWAWPDQQLSYH